MKQINMSQNAVVYAGETWKHASAPCSKEMMCVLERNEKIISWLQPTHGGVGEQIPA